ncbi:probable LRR receptor-like serine/threonine-protein kinase At4g29180 [Rhodamnia argentea]|uniref:Probable LRR receptor-like serine/threonine-protein kinase At4g29180 n=1 Tax=Rhodamnia argentea TaxID=178133 RepID=A0ABM3GS71_9MYRT|nr:probable LRR receptor-like serine/threonine-protein kinase At4g29180 [Rhodamnia argentea]
MVFKFATFDPARDPDDYNHAFPQSPWSSSSLPSAAAATICQPCDSTDGCIRSLVSRLVVAEPRERMLKLKYGPFKYGELARVTRNFGTVLVEGGSGNVYFGTLEDGTEVAVKVFFCFSIQGSREFQAKAKNLRAVHHENLVPLLGYCDGTKTKALIYEFMDGGNLRQNLTGDRPNFLTWSKRLQIAVDIAQGLHYLHHGCHPPIIHGDLSAANIWLNEEMQAKIADFGISAFAPRALDSYPTCPLGTPGYFDPEFFPYSRPDRKSDVYSFGIILFELITGHPAVTRGAVRNVFLLQWMTPIVETKEIQMIMDPSLQGKFDIDSAWKAVEIAGSCTRPTGEERPDITHVLAVLSQSLALELASQYCHS